MNLQTDCDDGKKHAIECCRGPALKLVVSNEHSIGVELIAFSPDGLTLRYAAEKCECPNVAIAKASVVSAG